MKKKDQEASKAEAERNKREIERLLSVLKEKTDRVPESVVNGNHQIAVAFKSAAQKAQRILHSKRPTLKAAQECVAEFSRF